MKVGIMGCGRIALERHAPECCSHPDIELAGFFDRQPVRAQKLADLYGGRVYGGELEMLADPAVDAVIVCTSNTTHSEISIAALRAGKHVLCEKPMAVSAEQARQVEAAANAGGRLYMVAHNQRFDQVNRKAKELLDAGALGRIISYRAEFSHGGPEGWSVDAQKGMYFKKEQNALGAIGDLGIHKIDLMRWLLKDEIAEVSACLTTLDKRDAAGRRITLDDNAWLTLKTETGRFGLIGASWTNYGHCESSAVIFGSDGVMTVSDTNSDSLILIERANGLREEYRFPRQPRSGVADAFAAAIESGGPSPVSAYEGLRGMQVVDAALESSGRDGCFIKLI